ncbi:hypothetical protein M1271_00170 [Patescibacteria group bacterium]|nr:hypothetical protein [Patescibacteria group bacterium]MCL5797779.1 hypothetical protein [Patescibacteria group bacterium]
MKNNLRLNLAIKSGLLICVLLGLITLLPGTSLAQGMMDQNQYQKNTASSNSSSNQEEAQGKAIFDKLQAKQTICRNLTDGDFDLLGDYFMGQRLGSAHESMDNIMTQMMGEEGNRQMHISLGKRLSGCDASFPIPTQGEGFLPMMGLGMMGNGWGNTRNSTNFSMMGYISGMMGGNNTVQNILVPLTWIASLVFLILGSIYFFRGIKGKGRK